MDLLRIKLKSSFEEAEKVLQKYERLSNRRNQPAKVLSGGERRLLEISRALVMKTVSALIDEPSIGLEPKYIDMVFEIFERPSRKRKKNNYFSRAKCEKRFRIFRYWLCSSFRSNCYSGQLEKNYLINPDVGRLFSWWLMVNSRIFFKGLFSVKSFNSPGIALGASFIAIGALLKNIGFTIEESIFFFFFDICSSWVVSTS